MKLHTQKTDRGSGFGHHRLKGGGETGKEEKEKQEEEEKEKQEG